MSGKKIQSIPRPMSEEWVTGETIWDILARAWYKLARMLASKLFTVSFNGKSTPMNIYHFEVTCNMFWVHINRGTYVSETINAARQTMKKVIKRNKLYYSIDYDCIMLMVLTQDCGYECNVDTIVLTVNKLKKLWCDMITEHLDAFPRDLHPTILSY